MASSHPSINVLVNNAGIQRALDLKKGAEDIKANDDEISINLRAQIYLAASFVPLFSQRQGESAIVNVSSGLGFVPLARFPVYCATKAAIHSFTVSLRYQLRETPVRVFEVIPPTVYDTELKGKPLPRSDWTVSSAEVADAVVNGMGRDEPEISVGPTKGWLAAYKGDLDAAFTRMNPP